MQKHEQKYEPGHKPESGPVYDQEPKAHEHRDEHNLLNFHFLECWVLGLQLR